MTITEFTGDEQFTIENAFKEENQWLKKS
jgi:hypothetical protein